MTRDAAIFDCGYCGQSFEANSPMNSTECPTCGEQDAERVPSTSGYDKPHMLRIWARADMLESVGGMTLQDQERELDDALEGVSADDAESLRWAAVMIESRLGALAARVALRGED